MILGCGACGIVCSWFSVGLLCCFVVCGCWFGLLFCGLGLLCWFRVALVVVVLLLVGFVVVWVVYCCFGLLIVLF